MTLDDFARQIGLDAASPFARAAAPALRLRGSLTADLGSSRLGGLPDLPAELPWPCWDARTYFTLEAQRAREKLSAAGNDVIGADPAGVSALSRLLRDHQPGQPARAHIDEAMLASVLGDLENRYRDAIAKVRAEPGFADLPILIHGYDHALPSGFPGDRRDPIYADRDQWLGAPMHAHGIEDFQLREAIIRELIDELYAMLGRVAGDPDQTRVHLVDARGAIGRDQWNDEIHGTDAGFAAVAARFRQVLQSAMTS